MDCPKCGVKLARDQYENAAVYLCTRCSGYLIKRNRLLLIKQSRERSQGVLEREAAAESDADSEDRLRCPRCRVDRMHKERVRIEPEGEFQLDVCKKCRHVWFDGGELARWQLDHEAGASAQEAERFRRQVESRTEQEQEAWERQLAEVPEAGSLFGSTFLELVLIGTAVVCLFWGVGAVFFGYRGWATVASLGFCGSVGWLAVHHFHTQRAQLAVLGTLALAELAFLAYLFFGSY